MCKTGFTQSFTHMHVWSDTVNLGWSSPFIPAGQSKGQKWSDGHKVKFKTCLILLLTCSSNLKSKLGLHSVHTDMQT